MKKTAGLVPALLLPFMGGLANGYLSDLPYLYREDRPLMLAHRGNYGDYPEHSLGAYITAYYAGCDYIELDLQVTADGHLIVIHDPHIGGTTSWRFDPTANERYWWNTWGFKKPYIPDMTLEEIREFTLLQRLKRTGRPYYLDTRYNMVTLQELVDCLRLLEKEFPRIKNRERKMGMYIELKDWQWSILYGGYSTADLLDEFLLKNGIGTALSCADDVPIVVQSFEWEVLEYWLTISDIPIAFAIGVEDAPFVQHVQYVLGSMILLIPFKTWTIIPDWEELSKMVIGIAPDTQWVTKPWSIGDPMTDDWDKSVVKNEYANFNRYMHSLDIAVHPWPIQDDKPIYRSWGFHEVMLYIDMKCDGIMGEYPENEYPLLEYYGNYSPMPHSIKSHLRSPLQDYQDFCGGNVHAKTNMSLEVFFGSTAGKTAFNTQPLIPKCLPVDRFNVPEELPRRDCTQVMNGKKYHRHAENGAYDLISA